jgi:opacity protein-like surface antigen
MVKMCIPAMPIAVRYTVGFERMNLKETVFPMGGNTSIFSGVADAMYGIPAGPVKLYALAGLGAFNARTNVSGFPGVSQTRFGLDGGAGVEFPVGMMSGFAEVRLQNIFTDSKTSTALGGNKEFPTRTIPISVGFYF